MSVLSDDRFLVELPLLRRPEERWVPVLPERWGLEDNRLEEVLSPERDDCWVNEVVVFFWALVLLGCRRDRV